MLDELQTAGALWTTDRVIACKSPGARQPKRPGHGKVPTAFANFMHAPARDSHQAGRQAAGGVFPHSVSLNNAFIP
jgi:hypothetical protein